MHAFNFPATDTIKLTVRNSINVCDQHTYSLLRTDDLVQVTKCQDWERDLSMVRSQSEPVKVKRGSLDSGDATNEAALALTSLAELSASKAEALWNLPSSAANSASVM